MSSVSFSLLWLFFVNGSASKVGSGMLVASCYFGKLMLNVDGTWCCWGCHLSVGVVVGMFSCAVAFTCCCHHCFCTTFCFVLFSALLLWWYDGTFTTLEAKHKQMLTKFSSFLLDAKAETDRYSSDLKSMVCLRQWVMSCLVSCFLPIHLIILLFTLMAGMTIGKSVVSLWNLKPAVISWHLLFSSSL